MKKIKHANAIITVALVVIIVLVAYGLNYQRTVANDLTGQIRDLQMAHGRLQFCHDSEIAPCSDDNIREWNKENPRDTFNL